MARNLIFETALYDKLHATGKHLRKNWKKVFAGRVKTIMMADIPQDGTPSFSMSCGAVDRMQYCRQTLFTARSSILTSSRLTSILLRLWCIYKRETRGRCSWRTENAASGSARLKKKRDNLGLAAVQARD